MQHLFHHISSEQIHRLFPFHMAINRDLSISSCGNSLLKLNPGMEGRHIDDFFLMKRPGLARFNFQEIVDKMNELFIIHTLSANKVILRGQFEYVAQTDQLLFLGTPWFNSVEEMNETGLALDDFAVHDFLPDMMMLIKTLQNANDDVKQVIGQLQVQKDAVRKISSIVEKYPHPVVICNPDLTIAWVNDAFTKENGYTLKEVAGKKPAAYLYANHTDISLIIEIERRYTLGENFTYELLNKNKEDKLYWISLQGQCMKDNSGNAIQYFFVQQNISKQKEAEKRIIETLQKEMILGDLKSRFVTMASHEFRTPMTAIKLQAELIGMQLEKNAIPGSEKIKNNLCVIDTEIDRLTRLIEDILLLGKIEQSELKLEKKRINIVTLIYNEIERQNTLYYIRDKIELTVKGSIQDVFVDEIKLSHIVENLVSNAIKYSDKREIPIVTLWFHQRHFEIIVKDHGIGIPFSEQSRIMDTFFRASNAINIKGTGIGMSIVKNFVELHKGTIHFTSIPDQGSEFTVSIPY